MAAVWPRVVVCLGLLTTVASALQILGKYNVDQSQISVSGISSGAGMTTQLHVAFSSVFMGAGLVAGNPYWCAKDSTLTATTDCMSRPDDIDVSVLISQTQTYADAGDIDPTSNLYNAMVYIFSGTLDTVVDQGVGLKAEEYYDNYVRSSNIMTVYNLPAQHTFPTVDYGNPCSYLGEPYIGICDYYGAYEIMNHIYGGGLTKPTDQTTLTGEFYEFDQTEFISGSASDCSMDDVGYIYVPSQCVSGQHKCRLHVAIHGCNQGRYILGDDFASNAGYNEVGELNDIIILYPQAVPTAFINAFGCWDWWGYTSSAYATKYGDQMQAIYGMVQQIAF